MMRVRPRANPWIDGMGLMSSTSPRRAYALVWVVAIALLLVLCAAPSVQATPPTIEPAAAITVTIVLNRAAYLSGDVAIATAMVYRTPGPANYTYNWTVRDTSGRLLNTTIYGVSKFTYTIPLNYTGWLVFAVRVDDAQGLTSNSQQFVYVYVAVMSLRLDRGDFSPGDTITASYSVSSHVILRPTYDYEVDDTGGTIVLSGNTNNTTFSFRTPAPAASRTYRFLVTAREGTNTSRAQLFIGQATGALLGATFDRASYTPGDSIHAHLTVTPRGTMALPLQFTWTLSLGPGFGGWPTVSAITTVPEVDLSLPIPQGVGTGDLVVIATESSTMTSIWHTLHVGTTNTLWSTDIGGVPLFAVLLGLLFILLLVAVLGLWRRVGGGHLMGPRAAPPPPPGGTTQAPTTMPMSVICSHCGKSIDITTSKRPIEVMCPSCGETQLVA